MRVLTPGICRHCGCTANTPCRLFDGDECCWIDGSMLVCSAPGCVKAEAARLRAAKAERPAKPRSRFAGWGYGAVAEELRREAHGRARRGKGRAKG